jgi:hypothetical protein
MWLVLCDPTDVAAQWLFAALRGRGLAPLELVTTDALAFCEVWEHRVGRGTPTLKLRLENGLEVDGSRLRGVVNRLYTPPMPHWRSASKADQDYVQQELIAFYLSWLHALPCPVLNRPTPQGLCGQWRHESEWVWLAHKAGLSTPPYLQTSDDRVDESKGERRLVPPGTLLRTVVMVEGLATGVAVSPAVVDGCQRLAKLAATDVLGIDFFSDATGSWMFVGANPAPDLRVGGEPLLAALVQRLTAEREAA